MREQRMWCMKEWSLMKLSVPREKTFSWQTRCRQQCGKCEFCYQCAPELIRDRFIVGINDRTLMMKPQNDSRRPFHVLYKRQVAAMLDNRKSLLITFLAIHKLAILDGHFLDDRKSLSIAFLAISDQYAIFILKNHKMAAGGHFGWPKITFDRIARHFRKIRKIFLFWKLFTKWPPAPILDYRKSLSIAFLAILPKSIWTSIVGQWLHHICSSSVHFWLSYAVHKLVHHIFTKWTLAAILVFPIISKIDRVLPL